jgi:hypothetical protein
LDAVCNIYEYIVQPNSLGNLLSNFNNLNSGVLILNVNPLIGEVVVGAVLVFFVYLFSDFIYSYLLLSILPLSNCANLEGKATRSRPTEGKKLALILSLDFVTRNPTLQLVFVGVVK